MKERPILFSAPMVRAILDDTKTQTRRVVKLPYHNPLGAALWHTRTGDCIAHGALPGDRLWVRETWSICEEYDYLRISEMDFRHKRDLIYAADGICTTKKRPSIFMPRWASRITLEITAVRVERLQDISEADCIAEGSHRTSWEYDNGECPDTAREAYEQLWNSINGPATWDKNPWVWVIKFKRINPGATIPA